MEPESRRINVLKSRELVKTLYVWVQNPDSSEQRIVLESDIDTIYRMKGPSDRIYMLGQEIKLELAVKVTPSKRSAALDTDWRPGSDWVDPDGVGQYRG